MKAVKPSTHKVSGQGTACGAPETLRLDVWLWRARFYKSRSQCTRKVRGGDIRLRRCGQITRVSKPNTILRPGDRLTFMRGEELFHIEVMGLGTRRGPASEAQMLYTRLAAAITPVQNSSSLSA